MVSLWPWKGKDSSPAEFEKTLSTLSTKIGKASSGLEATRQRGRRFKALWTLYTSFVYLLYLMIAGLVVGWQNWSSIEYTIVSSSPLAIYVVRLTLSSYYDYKSSKQQAYLQSLQRQRDEAINKLKEATKYNTTQQLLEKYGGTPHKQGSKPKKEKGSAPQEQETFQKRRQMTGFVPPPTANIPGRRIAPATNMGNSQLPEASFHSESQSQSPQSATKASLHWQQQKASEMDARAEFAPNAFNEPRVYAPNDQGPRWYDRLMDVVLGEDESSPKNRLVLICQDCRLVNGQAPPGVKSLEEVGKWKCSSCGNMNGEDMETKIIVQSLEEHDEPLLPGEAAVEADIQEDTKSSDRTTHSDDEEADERPKVRSNPRKKEQT